MNAPKILLKHIVLPGKIGFVGSFRLVSQNDREMLLGQDYSYTSKSPEESFHIGLQEASGDFCEDFVLYEKRSESGMCL